MTMHDIPPFSLFEKIYGRHGHRCPMSTLGGRLGFAARRFLAGSLAEDLRAAYHARTCALDGIAGATGCSEQDGTLTVRGEGRHLLHLFDLRTERGVAVCLRPRALEIAWEYRLVSEALERDRPELAADEVQRRQQHAEEVLDRVLDCLRTLPEDELMELQPLISCTEGD